MIEDARESLTMIRATGDVSDPPYVWRTESGDYAQMKAEIMVPIWEPSTEPFALFGSGYVSR